MSLVTVGTMAFDDLETPRGKAEMIVGGANTYICFAAGFFTNDIKAVSVVGDDFPQEFMDDLRSRGIDLSGVQVKEGEKSFYWKGRYHDNMNARDTLDTQLNVLADFDPVLPESYRDAEFVMLGNLTPAVQMRVLEQLTSQPKLVAMDTMNFWMDIAMDELQQVIAKVDVLIINDEEARQLSGDYSLVTAAQTIHAMGPKTLVIKKGEHGALLFQKDDSENESRIFFAPALPLAEVFDPTGAGDTFAGGFMGYIAKTGKTDFESMKRAIIYGSALASFCVEKFGTERLREITEADLQARVERFVELVKFDVEY